MVTSLSAPRKRYSLFILAIVLLIAGGIAIVISGQSFPVLAFGLIILMAGVGLARASNIHAQAMPTGAGANPDRRRVGALGWISGGVSLLLVGFSYYLLHRDALQGYHEVWPVYLFAGAALFCAAAWGYLFAKFAS